MSWPEPVRRLGPALAALALACSLAGCFTPMYRSMHGELASELQAIAIDPVPERLGHYLGDELASDLNGTGSSPPIKYHLTLTTKERVQSALVDVVTRRATNAAVVTEVGFTLTPVGADKPIVVGSVMSAASYNRSEQRFANIRAARDAEIRNAKVLADEITQRIAAALAEHSS